MASQTIQLPTGETVQIPDGQDPQKYYDQAMALRKTGLPAATTPPPQQQDSGPLAYLFNGAGRAIERTGQNLQGIYQGVKNTGEGLIHSMSWNPDVQQQGVQQLKQMYLDPSLQENSLARQSPDFPTAMGHAVGEIPLVGKGILGIGHEATHGDPAGALIDSLFMGLASKGSDVMDAIQKIPGAAGREIYKAGIPMDRENLSPTSQNAVGNRMYDADVGSKRGPTAQPDLDKVQALINQDIGEVNNRAQTYPGGMPTTAETIGPVEQAIAARRLVEDQQAVPLEQHLSNYVEKQTGISRDPKNFPEDTDPRQYIQRVLGIDPGQDMEKWLAVNRAFNKIVPDKKAMQSGAVASEGSPGETMFNRLMQGGTREAIASRDPGLSELNQRVSQAIHIHQALTEISRQNPSKLTMLLPLVAGGATGSLMHLLHLPMGGSMETMAPVMGGAIATYIMRAAFKDPVTLMQTGLALKHMGEGPLGSAMIQLMSHAPKTTFAGRDLTIKKSQGQNTQGQ